MIEKLLRAKHWQLFVATFGTVFVGQLIIMSFAFGSDGDPKNIASAFAFFPIILAIVLYVQMGWQYGLIFKLKDKINSPLNLPYKRIKAFFFIPIGYFVILLFLMFILFSNVFTPGFRPGAGFFGIIALMVPLHFFSIFCMFHTMYFAAKTVKIVEMKKENVTFNDFAGEFFLIWFYPIGVWILQPKVNKLMNDEIVGNSDSLDDIIETIDDPNEIV